MFWKIIIGVIQVSEVIKSGRGGGVGIKGFTDMSQNALCLQGQLLFSLIHFCHVRLCFTKSSDLIFFVCLVFIVVFLEKKTEV